MITKTRHSVPRALLIDLDNCPQQIADLPKQLDNFSRIIACHGSVEPKMPLSLVRALATAIHEGKLEFVGMEKKGKNAADFGLAFYAGRLLMEMPPETEFVVLSKDGDLDHAVNMLRREGRVAKRVDDAPHLPGMSNADAVDEFYTGRLQANQHRPLRRRTLLSSIRSFYKGRGDGDPQAVLDALLRHGLVAFDAQGLASYPQLDAAADAAQPAPSSNGPLQQKTMKT